MSGSKSDANKIISIITNLKNKPFFLTGQPRECRGLDIGDEQCEILQNALKLDPTGFTVVDDDWNFGAKNPIIIQSREAEARAFKNHVRWLVNHVPPAEPRPVLDKGYSDQEIWMALKDRVDEHAISNDYVKQEAQLLMRFFAIYNLGQLRANATDAVPVLTNALSDANAKIRWLSAAALGKFGPDASPAVPALIEALKDSDAQVRRLVAKSLGRIGPDAKAAVPALIMALRDSDDNVRSKAAWSLGQIGPDAKAAVPALIMALRDSNAYVRSFAASALGRIGKDARIAIPHLATVELNDPNYGCREIAKEARAKIEAEIL